MLVYVIMLVDNLQYLLYDLLWVSGR